MKNENRKRATRRDVAAEAGVTETIVSYVLNGNRYVSADKKERVMAAVEKLGYRPNYLARSLRIQESRHLLFLTDDLASEHFGRVVSFMESLLNQEGYIFSLSRYRDDRSFIEDILARQFDGIFISSTAVSEKTLRRFSLAGVPAVMVRRGEPEHVPDHCAVLDSGLYPGELLLLEHLWDKGCRRPLFVNRHSVRTPETFANDPRVRAYAGFCRQKAIPERVLPPLPDENSFREQLAAALAGPAETRPDALAAFNDTTAAEALAVVRELGLRVPEDLCVTGFDNTRLSRYTTPPLTTISINRRDMAEKMVRLMMKLLREGTAENDSCLIELVCRDSSRKERAE